MSSKRHKRSEEIIEPDLAEEVVSIPEKVEYKLNNTPFLLSLILILLILTFAKKEILAKIKSLFAQIIGSADDDDDD